jgi:hypothetical protein
MIEDLFPPKDIQLLATQIEKLREKGLTRQDLVLCWFTRKIQSLQHLGRLIQAGKLIRDVLLRSIFCQRILPGRGLCSA